MSGLPEPFSWRTQTQDPNDLKVRAECRAFLKRRRVLLKAGPDETLAFFVDVSRDKSVLDIGVCEHTDSYIDSPNWKHKHISEAASYCLGIDILDDLVTSLSAKGFNIRCVDALSDTDLGERFDRVICGDVIEHVDNPNRLLRFAKRHLKTGGSIFVSTPNPYSLRVIREVLTKGTFVANFDHVAWYTPSVMNEVAERAELSLRAYYVFVGSPDPIKNALKRIFPAEMQPLTIIYELGF